MGAVFDLDPRQDDGEEELVPGLDEGEHAGREQGGQRDGQDDEPEHLEGARAVHGGGPLELDRDGLEEALQDPDDDRQA